MVANPFPPMEDMRGASTPTATAFCTAASNALPPSCKMCMPAIEARGSSELATASSKREVAVQLDHGVAGLDGIVGIDLNFVVVLGGSGEREERAREGQEQGRQEEFGER